MSEQRVNIPVSVRFIFFPLETRFRRLWPQREMWPAQTALLRLTASQEAGRLDNYRDPHPIQMSIKLFRAWHCWPPPLTGRKDRRGERRKSREEIKRRLMGEKWRS